MAKPASKVVKKAPPKKATGRPVVNKAAPQKTQVGKVPAARRRIGSNLGRKAPLKAPKPLAKRITGSKTVKVRDLSNGAEYELPKRFRPVGNPYKVKQEVREEKDKIIITKTTSTTETFGKTTTYTRTTTEIAEVEEGLFRKLYGMDEDDYINRSGQIHRDLDEDAFPPYFDRL
jgi:hypothetical protein